jgi:hypothetical protein
VRNDTSTWSPTENSPQFLCLATFNLGTMLGQMLDEETEGEDVKDAVLGWHHGREELRLASLVEHLLGSGRHRVREARTFTRRSRWLG